MVTTKVYEQKVHKENEKDMKACHFRKVNEIERHQGKKEQKSYKTENNKLTIVSLTLSVTAFNVGGLTATKYGLDIIFKKINK